MPNSDARPRGQEAERERLFDALRKAIGVEAVTGANSSHDHGNCELCDHIEAKLATATADHAQAEQQVRTLHAILSAIHTALGLPADHGVSADLVVGRLRAAEVALRDLFALVTDGWLVRNTANDAHLPSFMAESARLVHVLGAAKNILTLSADAAPEETP